MSREVNRRLSGSLGYVRNRAAEAVSHAKRIQDPFGEQYLSAQ